MLDSELMIPDDYEFDMDDFVMRSESQNALSMSMLLGQSSEL